MNMLEETSLYMHISNKEYDRLFNVGLALKNKNNLGFLEDEWKELILKYLRLLERYGFNTPISIKGIRYNGYNVSFFYYPLTTAFTSATIEIFIKELSNE